MKDLSKEEKLEQEILTMAKKCGDKKWLRVKRTFFVISGGIYLIAFFPFLNEVVSDISIDIICGFLFAPPMMAGIVMFLSWAVLFYIVDGSMKEEKAIAKKIGELNAIKFSKNTCENEKLEEIKNQLEDLKNSLAQITDEYSYLRLKEMFNDEVNKNEKD